MEGRAEDPLGGADLDKFAQIHHADSVGQVADHGQIVGDEQVGGLAFALEVEQQVEDRRLDRHVQGGGRLVQDHQLRVSGEGAGDGDALALAAGQAVRGGGQHLGRELHVGEQCCGAVALAAAGQAGEHPDGAAEDRDDPLFRVEGRVGRLEHHLDIAALAAGAAGRRSGDALVVQRHGSGAGRDEAGDDLGEGRFAAAGFADEAEGFAGCDLQVDVVEDMGLAEAPADLVEAQEGQALVLRGLGVGRRGRRSGRRCRGPGFRCGRSSG